MSIQSLDETVKEQAIKFADQIKQAAEFAEKEEEIRIEAEKALVDIRREAGIVLKGRHEYTIGTGRADSVYGCVIIEYKNPHDPASRLSARKESRGNQEVIKQIKNRFLDLRKEQKQPMNAMFGVGCDGNYFIFVRSRDEKWFVEDPVEVNKYSAERFLWALINMGTKGKSFSPEYLSGDFGSESPVAQEGVRSFYNTILTTKSLRAQAFFQQWKILFGEVCGYDVDTPSDKIIELSNFYGIEGEPKPAELLFSIHTYYAIFMKLLASEVVAFFHKLPTPLQKILKAPTTNKLREEMTDLEQGSIFRHFNITNFLEGDIFLWYIDAYAWNDSIEKTIRKMAISLDAYNPGTLSEDSSGSRDLLKKLYQELFPISLRHDLGEYYTPDWLAEHVLNRLDYAGDPDKRLLDPACGSGTFLVMAINRIRKWYDQNRELCSYDEGELARKILNNVVGFDLNPLAVMAARTNYLIAMRDLIGRVGSFEIPVYLCDSIMTPAEYGGIDSWTTGQKIKTKELITSVAKFKIPLDIAISRQNIAKYSELLEFCVENGYETDEFIQRCEDEGLTISARDMHADLYQELVRLKKENKNSVWARIIKNAFSPLFSGTFDYIAGNPPWINWESLPEDYRDAMKPLWQRYGLFSLSGSAGRLGGGKKDLSMLFVYTSVNHYLREGGQLGFVITQSIFKTKGAGDGFRNFKFNSGNSDIILVPKIVDDMSELRPFEGATNRTAVFVCRKSTEQFHYPISYFVWRKTSRREISQDASLEEVLRLTEQQELAATPVKKDVLTSPWLTAPATALRGIHKVLGTNIYPAYAGGCTWLNSVYWVNIIQLLPNDNLLVENLSDVGKIKMERIQTSIESDLIYPLIRGRDVRRWYSQSSVYIVLTQDPQTRAGIPEDIMRLRYPKTYAFLKNFEKRLRTRSGFRLYFRPTDPFYSIYNIGPYTMSPYKVLFKDLSEVFQCVVVGPSEDNYVGSKTILPDVTLRLIPFDNNDEAHYVSALLNSRPVLITLHSSSVGVQTQRYHPSDIEKISIPKYNPEDKLHKQLVALSKHCHEAAAEGQTNQIEKLESEIDKAAAELWNITDDELKALQNALEKMKRTRRPSKTHDLEKGE